jgi:hypothetical protein
VRRPRKTPIEIGVESLSREYRIERPLASIADPLKHKVFDAVKLDMEKMKFDYSETNITEFFTHLKANLQDGMKTKELE